MRGRRDKQHPLGAPLPICTPLLLSRAPSAPSPPLHAKGAFEQGCANGVHRPLVAMPPPCARPFSLVRRPPVRAPPLPIAPLPPPPVCAQNGGQSCPLISARPPQFPCARRSRPPP